MTVIRSSRAVATALVLAAATFVAEPALAHHAMGGGLPSTFMQGLLSGLAHPVIGPDHLAFLVAIGIAAALVGSGVAIIGAFIAASTAGVLLHVAKLDVPMVEPLVASSVIAAGILVAIGSRAGKPLWLVLAAAAGLIHGYAFGESIVGAERSVLGAYLVGIAIVSALVVAIAIAVSRKALSSGETISGGHRAAGGLVGVLGLGLLAMSLIAG